MRRFILLPTTVVAGITLEWVLAARPTWDTPPPLTAFVLCWWLWRLSAGKRFVLALVLGLASDAFSLYPPGTNILVFLAAAALTTFLQRILTNLDSPLTRGVGTALTLLAILLLRDPVALALRDPHLPSFLWNAHGYALQILPALLWTILLSGLVALDSILRRQTATRGNSLRSR